MRRQINKGDRCTNDQGRGAYPSERGFYLWGKKYGSREQKK